MSVLNCIVYTEKYIDKIIKPLKKFAGVIKDMKQTNVEKDFQDMKTAYILKIMFESPSKTKQFISYIQNKVSKKYEDFFLEVI
jgi:hypothetical protein